jgi:Ca-activated chloride channel family protein
VSFELGTPSYLYLLILIPILIWYRYLRRKKVHAPVVYSDTGLVRRIKHRGGLWPRYISPILKSLALIAIVFALARPRFARTFEEVKTEGIDIVLTLDISGSMKAEDFKPQNRLYVAKEVIKEFVQERTEDRLGLVVFAAQAFTQCPLTLDHNVLINFLDNVTFGMVEDGTAIGTAIANSCNRLKDSPSKSKVIVLLTDGVNNRGKIDPLTAADIAASLGIKIYTIGIGKPGNAPFPVDDPLMGRIYKYIPNALDEDVLTKVAETTGGIYFRAETGEKLSEVYKEISALETTEIKTRGYIQYRELFTPFLLTGLGFVLVETVLGRTRFRKIP